MAITPTKISPTTSIAVMTSLPSWAAVFTASGITIAMLTDAEAMGRERSLGVAAPGGAGGRPAPRVAAVAAQASPSPGRPSARSCAQWEISAARSATASTVPASAIRTRPCA